MHLPDSKLLNALERLSETLKSLPWEQAKRYGVSPIQIQILLFVAEHPADLTGVSYLAREFNVTKATVSDAVRALLKKGYLEKDHSPVDSRRYNLLLTPAGRELTGRVSDYARPVRETLDGLDPGALRTTFDTLAQVIYGLNQRGVIPVQRMCFNCRFYVGDKRRSHRCNLLEIDLKAEDVRMDCPEFSEGEQVG